MEADQTPGQEPNLYLLECRRCQESMQHLCEVVAAFPLCIHWELTCGECGQQVQAWEDLVVPIRYAGMGREEGE